MGTKRLAFRLSEEEYLDRYGVGAYLKDVATLLLENRPDDPCAFIEQYFRNAMQQEGSNDIMRAYRYLRLAPFSMPTFLDNVVSAFTNLTTQHNLASSDFLQLLRMLCEDLPPGITDQLLSPLETRAPCSISFEEFVTWVKRVLIFEGLFKDGMSRWRAAAQPLSVDAVLRELLGSAFRVSGSSPQRDKLLPDAAILGLALINAVPDPLALSETRENAGSVLLRHAPLQGTPSR
ncbi:putative tubulin polyglutamylase complex subunit 1 [Paratrimastix pyriformis]|uniref:Tubulin polyglutamylase complex subunit 1 n=1 Tax=Paratrimastix pyriformis TaxID=342808 RepID=A0ABQ8UNA3_9EUKA|nr:putative tubulin polyglutamylase complex subunit 1 [Paratrimastix pyriformis]